MLLHVDSEDSAQTGLASLLITQVSLFSCCARIELPKPLLSQSAQTGLASRLA